MQLVGGHQSQTAARFQLGGFVATELKFLQSRRALAHALTKKVDDRIVRLRIQPFAAVIRFSFSEPSSTFSKSEMAGPFSTRPSASKREPWHGQSQVFSQPSHRTMHFKCGQTAESLCNVPSSSRYAAIFFTPSRRSAPSPD